MTYKHALDLLLAHVDYSDLGIATAADRLEDVLPMNILSLAKRPIEEQKQCMNIWD